MTVLLASSIVLCAALAAAPMSSAPPTSLAPVVVDGLSLDAAARLEKALRRSFEARPGAVADAVARPMYEAARQNGLTCDVTAPDCLAQIGVVQGVDVILLARVGPDRIELTAVDVGSARPTRRATGALQSAAPEADIAAAFEKLASPTAAVTTLAVTAPAGASVDVDGVARGVAPIAPVGGLSPGPHVVRATLGGAVAETKVQVLLGETTTATVTPTPAVVDEDDDDRQGPRRPAPLPTVPLVVGGSIATVGSLMVLLGGFAWADLVEARGALGDLQFAADNGATVDDAFVSETSAARERFDNAAVVWNDQGIPLVALGLGVAGAGVGVIVTTLVLPRE